VRELLIKAVAADIKVEVFDNLVVKAWFCEPPYKLCEEKRCL